MKYRELLKENRELAKSFSAKPFRIQMLSNTVVDQLKDYLEYDLRSNGVFGEVSVGGFNNVVQDSFQLECDVLMVFLEAWNLAPNLHDENAFQTQEYFEELKENVCAQINTLLENAKSLPLVIVNTFTNTHRSGATENDALYVNFLEELNAFLNSITQTNLVVFDKNKVLNEFAEQSYFSSVHFTQFNIPYTKDFFQRYSHYAKFLIFDVVGKTKKVLLMDADNTLWKGILGEDGTEGIRMDGNSKEGKPFYEVQNRIKALVREGVVVGVCSKNNDQDILNVLDNHPNMLLNKDDFVIIKANWDKKSSNIRAIANELNVGLNSIVFWDDNDFELEEVSAELPEVMCFKVPVNTEDYSKCFEEQMGWFYKRNISTEDKLKTKLYKTESVRVGQRKKFNNADDFLQSLGLELTISKDEKKDVERLSQLSLKTNQFNLSTKRYSVADINTYVADPLYTVYSMRLKDKYGDYGLVGLCICESNKESKTVQMDTLLFSCRVLGRKIENSFLKWCVEDLKNEGAEGVRIPFLASDKNSQVLDFLKSQKLNEQVTSTGTEFSVNIHEKTMDPIAFVKINTEHGKRSV